MTTKKGSFWLMPGTSISPALLADIFVCTSAHERLPALEGVHFNNKHAVASDSHNLRVLNMVSPQGEINAVILPTAELLQKLGEFAFDEVEVIISSDSMIFMFDDSPIEVELSALEYPRYGLVLRQLEKCNTFLSFDKGCLNKMLTFGKENKTDVVQIIENKGNIKGNVFDCFNVVNRPDWEPNGVVCPVLPSANLEHIGFSLKSLCKVSEGFEEEIILGFYEQFQGAGIWLRSSGMDVNDEFF